MVDAPTRRFRFSLITLIVAVNVAGSLLWANLNEHKILIGSKLYSELYNVRGWPFNAILDRLTSRSGGLYLDINLVPTVRAGAVLGNVVLGLAIVMAPATLTEFLVRRLRKAKRYDG